MNEIIETDNTGIFDKKNYTFKFIESWMMLHIIIVIRNGKTYDITKNAMDYFVNSWNSHRVPGPRVCIPFENMIHTKMMSKIPEYLVLNSPEAISMFEAHRGQSTRSVNFGIDLLIQRRDLYESRLTLFHRNAPPQREIFSDVIHGNLESLRESLRLFHNITLNLGNNF